MTKVWIGGFGMFLSMYAWISFQIKDGFLVFLGLLGFCEKLQIHFLGVRFWAIFKNLISRSNILS